MKDEMARKRKSKIRLLLKLGSFILAFTLLGVFGIWGLWKNGILVPWLQAKVIQVYSRRIAPQLPFKIESFDLQGDWRNMIEGKFSKMKTRIRKNALAVDLDGPLEIQLDRTKKEWRVQYDFQISIQLAPDLISPALPIHLKLRAAQDFSNLYDLSLNSETARWNWEKLGLQLENLKWDLNWKPNDQGHLNLQTKSLDLQKEGTSHIGDLRLDTHLSPDFKNLTVNLSSSGAEVLWKDLYLDIPLKTLPIHANISLEKLIQAKILIGTSKSKKASIGLQFHSPNQFELNWNTTLWKISDLIASTLEATQATAKLAQLSILKKISFSSGTFKTDGRLSVENGKPSLNSLFRVNDLSMRWAKQNFAMKGFNLDLPLSSSEQTRGTLSLNQLYFRRLSSSLQPTEIQITPQFNNPKYPKFRFKIAPPNSQPKSRNFLPLLFDGIPLRIGQLEGWISSSDFELNSFLNMNRLEFEKIKNLFCIDSLQIPPGSVNAYFQKIEVTPSSVDLTGSIHASLFDGKIDIDEIGLFDLDNPISELDFNLDFSGIRLDRLGEWIGFGKMDGVIEGYAHDVTFQSLLPTQYVFSIDAKPLHSNHVIFSPEAMKNFIQVFAGDNFKTLPGIAQWYAFGLPRRIFGGYDIQYAGVTLISNDGRILVEAHDPPETLEKDPTHHYLLSGNNIKMPLRSSHYPLIVDAISMTDYVHQMATRFGGLNQEKQKDLNQKDLKDEKNPSCQPPL